MTVIYVLIALCIFFGLRCLLCWVSLWMADAL